MKNLEKNIIDTKKIVLVLFSLLTISMFLVGCNLYTSPVDDSKENVKEYQNSIVEAEYDKNTILAELDEREIKWGDCSKQYDKLLKTYNEVRYYSTYQYALDQVNKKSEECRTIALSYKFYIDDNEEEVKAIFSTMKTDYYIFYAEIVNSIDFFSVKIVHD
jgi:hypothetical protein